MKLFKRLFKKKEEEEIAPPIEEDFNEDDPICESCKMHIQSNQQVKTFNGKKFHLKPCWRNLQKEAMRNYKGY